MSRIGIALRCALLPSFALASVYAQAVNDEFFEKKIRPVLAEKCYGCHSSKLKAPMAALVLDTKAGARQGGSSGPAVVPGKPADSALVKALHYEAKTKMPPSGKLPDAVIADFEQWIAAGAPDPRTETAGATPVRRVVDEKVVENGRKWWAFQPVHELAAPKSANQAWARRKLDSFVLAKLDEKNLKPSSAADDRTLLRRAYVDLLGYKPTFEEIEAYAADTSADKYEKLVDRLLASPQYGERWARYWLDVVRYAEDNQGALTNPPYPHAFRYRDWVIEAMNKDVPYDKFVKLQLAADLLPGTSREDMRALGYFALSPQDHKDVRLSTDVVGTLQLNDWDERVDALGRGLLGLSVACARCHDHKFDPIPQKDYYRLEGVFASTSRSVRPYFDVDPQAETRWMYAQARLYDLHYTANLLESDPGSKPEQAKEQVKKFRAEIAALTAEVDAMSQKYPQMAAYIRSAPYPGEKPEPRNPATPAGKPAANLPAPVEPDAVADAFQKAAQAQTALDRRRRGGKQIDPKAPFLNSIFDAGLFWDTSEPDLSIVTYKPGVPQDLPVYRGGNLSNPGEIAPRGFPMVLAKNDPNFHKGSGRAELGDKIFSDAAPLSSRVIVNRVWGWHFDKHLVSTPSDFGSQGAKPTHPELLEDLAARFIANGWSMKWLHKEIMMSATYRQSSHPRADAQQVDPGNELLWRMNPRRMDIEAYRDTILRISGNLDTKMYGESEDPETGSRRTVYAKLTRRGFSDVLRLYDVSQPMMHIPMRVQTMNPLQALFVMNSAFIQQQAESLAKSVEKESAPADKVRALYRTVFAREVSGKELDLGLSYLNKASVPQYAQALLSTNEVIFWP